MKKKITLIFALVLSVLTIFSMSAVGAVAETPWKVTVSDQSVIKGTNSVTINYTLKYGDDEVTAILNAAADGVEYLAKPYVLIFEGETQIAEGTTIITKDMDIGEKQLTLKIYDKKGQANPLDETTFKLTISKQDNTMTYVMIGLIVLIVGYLIWSTFNNKKKQKKAQETVNELKIGDKVKTIGGVCGFVKEINDKENTFILEVGEKSYVKFDKGAIYQTAPANGSFDDANKKGTKEEKADKKEEKKD